MKHAKESPDAMPPAAPRSPRCEQILRNALTVFARDGFGQADVQEIADLSGVGKGTVYREFGNKESLFLAAARFARASMVCEIDRRADVESDPLERLKTGMRACLQFCDAHPEVVEMLVQERALFRGQTPTFFDRPSDEVNLWNERLKELVDRGIFRDLPVARIDEVLSKFVLGTMFVSFFAGTAKSLAEQYDETIDVVFGGLLSPELGEQALPNASGD